MKILFAVLAVICFTSVYAGHAGKPTKAEVEECARENNFDMKMFDQVHKDPDFKPSREMHCFAACTLKKGELMDANGKYTKQFDESELSKECKPELGKDECETAGKLMACIIQNDLMKKIKAKVEKP